MSELSDTIAAIGGIITPIGVAFIVYQQNKQGKKQDSIHQQINGMQEKIIIAEKTVSKEEGNKEGRSELLQEQKDET